ncbi:MAG: Rieske (2Fe-2S) protein [Pedosphaera sp.]|nr:Rieske (2Fe-2S) protein [Pedosphaera sp.]
MMQTNDLHNRRRFIKTVAVTSAYSALLGKGWNHVLAAEVSLHSASTTGTLRLSISKFPALQVESGSIRLGLNPIRGNPPGGPMPNGPYYPIIINRGPNNTFFGLNSRCSHQLCAVDVMDPSSNEITCPCHGSGYAIDGKKIRGPATQSLSKYATAFDGNDLLTIQIPGLGYSVTATDVQPGAGPGARLKMQFAALRNVGYEIQWRASLEKEPVIVPFSRTADGGLNETVFTATTNTTAGIFIERQGEIGFCTVAVRVAEI